MIKVSTLNGYLFFKNRCLIYCREIPLKASKYLMRCIAIIAEKYGYD